MEEMFVGREEYLKEAAAIYERLGRYIYLFDEIYFECDEYSVEQITKWLREITECSDRLYNKDLMYNELLAYETDKWRERVHRLGLTEKEVMGFMIEEDEADV